MQWADVIAPPSSTKLRQFAVLCLIFSVAIASWRFLHGHRGIDVAILGGLGITVGVLGWVRPAAIRLLYTGWMVAAFPLGWTISRVMLGVLFFGVFTCVSLIFRIMGRDSLQLTRHDGVESYWMPKPEIADSATYLRPF
jgi:Saxitoxin biosynthesis operon protein SxtJ